MAGRTIDEMTRELLAQPMPEEKVGASSSMMSSTSPRTVEEMTQQFLAQPLPEKSGGTSSRLMSSTSSTTIEDITEDLLAMPQQERKTGIFGGIANRLRWFNEPFDTPPTLGNLLRKLTFQEPKEDKATRLGRLTERGVFVVGAVLALMTTGGIGPILLLGAAKFAAVLAGEIVQPFGHGAEGFFRMLDRKFGPSNKPDFTGASNSGEDPVGATHSQKRGLDNSHDHGMDQEMVERPVGARKFADMSIRGQFGDNAADQRDRQPAPTAPANVHGFGGNKM